LQVYYFDLHFPQKKLPPPIVPYNITHDIFIVSTRKVTEETGYF
jgi:hypothetical protein